MNEHWDAAEADFQRFYGLDLRRVCYGPSPLGTRRLKALVEGLPSESSLYRVLHPGAADWGHSEELLAILAELQDEANRMFYTVNWRKAARKPIQLRRPWQATEPVRPVRASHEEILRFFGGRN